MVAIGFGFFRGIFKGVGGFSSFGHFFHQGLNLLDVPGHFADVGQGILFGHTEALQTLLVLNQEVLVLNGGRNHVVSGKIAGDSSFNLNFQNVFFDQNQGSGFQFFGRKDTEFSEQGYGLFAEQLS